MDTESIPENVTREEKERAYQRAYRQKNLVRIRERQQKWRERNRERVRFYSAANRRKYRQADPEKYREQDRRWRAAHRAPVLIRLKQWRQRNKEHLAAYDKAYREAHVEKVIGWNKVWRMRRAAYVRARYKAWLRNHPDRARFYNIIRRARKSAAPINDFTDAQFLALCKAVGYRCCYCGKKFPSTKLTPDHLTPYAKQGSNTLHNILPCCGSCNSRKKDRAVLRPVQPFLLVDDSAAD